MGIKENYQVNKKAIWDHNDLLNLAVSVRRLLRFVQTALYDGLQWKNEAGEDYEEIPPSLKKLENLSADLSQMLLQAAREYNHYSENFIDSLDRSVKDAHILLLQMQDALDVLDYAKDLDSTNFPEGEIGDFRKKVYNEMKSLHTDITQKLEDVERTGLYFPEDPKEPEELSLEEIADQIKEERARVEEEFKEELADLRENSLYDEALNHEIRLILQQKTDRKQEITEEQIQQNLKRNENKSSFFDEKADAVLPNPENVKRLYDTMEPLVKDYQASLTYYEQLYPAPHSGKFGNIFTYLERLQKAQEFLGDILTVYSKENVSNDEVVETFRKFDVNCFNLNILEIPEPEEVAPDLFERNEQWFEKTKTKSEPRNADGNLEPNPEVSIKEPIEIRAVLQGFKDLKKATDQLSNGMRKAIILDTAKKEDKNNIDNILRNLAELQGTANSTSNLPANPQPIDSYVPLSDEEIDQLKQEYDEELAREKENRQEKKKREEDNRKRVEEIHKEIEALLYLTPEEKKRREEREKQKKEAEELQKEHRDFKEEFSIDFSKADALDYLNKFNILKNTLENLNKKYEEYVWDSQIDELLSCVEKLVEIKTDLFPEDGILKSRQQATEVFNQMDSIRREMLQVENVALRVRGAIARESKGVEDYPKELTEFAETLKNQPLETEKITTACGVIDKKAPMVNPLAEAQNKLFEAKRLVKLNRQLTYDVVVGLYELRHHVIDLSNSIDFSLTPDADTRDIMEKTGALQLRNHLSKILTTCDDIQSLMYSDWKKDREKLDKLFFNQFSNQKNAFNATWKESNLKLSELKESADPEKRSAIEKVAAVFNNDAILTSIKKVSGAIEKITDEAYQQSKNRVSQIDLNVEISTSVSPGQNNDNNLSMYDESNQNENDIEVRGESPYKKSTSPLMPVNMEFLNEFKRLVKDMKNTDPIYSKGSSSYQLFRNSLDSWVQRLDQSGQPYFEENFNRVMEEVEKLANGYRNQHKDKPLVDRQAKRLKIMNRFDQLKRRFDSDIQHPAEDYEHKLAEKVLHASLIAHRDRKDYYNTLMDPKKFAEKLDVYKQSDLFKNQILPLYQNDLKTAVCTNGQKLLVNIQRSLPNLNQSKEKKTDLLNHMEESQQASNSFLKI